MPPADPKSSPLTDSQIRDSLIRMLEIARDNDRRIIALNNEIGHLQKALATSRETSSRIANENTALAERVVQSERKRSPDPPAWCQAMQKIADLEKRLELARAGESLLSKSADGYAKELSDTQEALNLTHRDYLRLHQSISWSPRYSTLNEDYYVTKARDVGEFVDRRGGGGRTVANPVSPGVKGDPGLRSGN